MTTYSAVVTTGIYCRPGCSAKPLAENVRTFELAAAAEAADAGPRRGDRPRRAPRCFIPAPAPLVQRPFGRDPGSARSIAARALRSAPPGRLGLECDRSGIGIRIRELATVQSRNARGVPCVTDRLAQPATSRRSACRGRRLDDAPPLPSTARLGWYRGFSCAEGRAGCGVGRRPRVSSHDQP